MPEQAHASTRSLSPAPARFYRPELDALRCIAFLLVFCFHRLDFVPQDPAKHPWLLRLGIVGAFGVPVFFLLSAFLITELLLRERAQAGRIHIGAFYLRRILRIWPLYFAVFFGLAVLTRFIPDVGATAPGSWAAFSLFAGNWYILRHGWIAGPVDPLWSISVEEQFYIVIPLVAALGGRRALQAIASALLAVSYIVIFRYTLHPVVGDNGMWTDSFVQFQFFCAGVLLSTVLAGRLPSIPVSVRLLTFLSGLALWFVALVRFDVKSWEPHPTPLGALVGWALVLLGTTLLFLAVFGLASHRVPRTLAYLGRISYGLYLFHSLVLFLVFTKSAAALDTTVRLLRLPSSLRDTIGTVVVLASTTALASLSFRFFERPILRLKAAFTFVPAREDAEAAQLP